MNDNSTPAAPATTDLGDAIDLINGERAVEIEEHQIQSLNDQVREHEHGILENEAAIEQYQDAIKARRKDNKRRQRLLDNIRARRTAHADAAFRLRMLEQP